MADIRINALATTATTPASDDYLALDGTAQGTRKILATNIANNVTDVILGSSGPSVKSTLSARAPRQGLVFDGTAGATASVPAFGTADFTVSLCLKPTTLANSQRFLGGTANGFEMATDASGGIFIIKNGVATTGSWASVLTAGKWQTVTYRRTGGVGTLYINGVANGSTISDSVDYSGGIGFIGAAAASGATVSISSLVPLIYNRALSASEVVSLYEAGAPAGADYPGTAAGTSLSTSAFSGTRWGASYSVFSGASATGFHAERASGGGDDSVTSDSFTVKKGDIIRCVFDMTNSGDLPYIYLGEATTGAALSGLSVTTAGTAQVFNLTVTTAGSARVAFYTANAQTANYTIANFTARPLGLLLAPDAAQSGGGLVWYDTSGNAANITLPASGVSWNVPSSGYWGGNLTAAKVLVGDGTTSAPSYAFSSDTDTGLSWNGSGEMLFTANGQSGGTLLFFQQGTSGIIAGGNSAGGARLSLGNTGSIGLTSAGTNQNITLTPSGTGIVSINRGLAASATGTAFIVQTTDASSLSLFAELEGNATSASRYVTLNSYMGGGGGGRNLVLNRYGGNLLIGTTVDSSALLQVGTNTTTAAGGMKFGTDTSWYRSSGGVLTLDTSAGFQGFEARRNGTTNLNFYSNSSNAFIGYLGTGSLTIQTLSGSPALTLDSSQNATFAGKSNFNRSGGTPTYNSDCTIKSYGAGVGSLELNTLDGTDFVQFANGATLKGNIIARESGATLRISTGTSVALALTTTGSDTNGIRIDTSGNLIAKLNGTAPSLGTNSTMTFELTSNTSLTIKVRGTDGTTRSVALTLA